MDKFSSYALHALVGILVTAAPAVIAGVPDSLSSMTVGAILMMVFKLAHDYAGY